jgi:hypothetical protein
MEVLQQHLGGLLSSDIQARNLAENSFNSYWIDNAQNAKSILPLLCVATQSEFPLAVPVYPLFHFHSSYDWYRIGHWRPFYSEDLHLSHIQLLIIAILA